MTVKELKEQLEGIEDKTEVVVTSPLIVGRAEVREAYGVTELFIASDTPVLGYLESKEAEDDAEKRADWNSIPHNQRDYTIDKVVAIR